MRERGGERNFQRKRNPVDKADIQFRNRIPNYRTAAARALEAKLKAKRNHPAIASERTHVQRV